MNFFRSAPKMFYYAPKINVLLCSKNALLCHYAFNVYYAQNYASRIRQGLTYVLTLLILWYYLIHYTCTATGLWSPDYKKSVTKEKVSSRCCSCSWTNDGQYFAIGHHNGAVTFWTKVCICTIMCGCIGI